MRILIILSILLSTNMSFSQNVKTTKRNVHVIKTKSTNRIDDKLYNKITGEKIDIDQLKKITQEHPGIVFEREINKYGKIERYYFNPNNILTEHPGRDIENQTKEAELFPEFVFETIDGEIIDSDDLRGKWVLIRFDLMARFMRKTGFYELDNQINNLDNDLISIICLADDKENISSEIKIDNSNFKFVDDGRNFHEKFNIIGFPTTLILDTQGRVYKYFYPGEEIDLKSILKN